MYAIIKTGGKQYRVQKDDVIDVELVTAADDNIVEFKEILLVQNGDKTHAGSNSIANFIVKGEVLGVAAGPKVIAYKYKRRKNSRRTVGHRQKYSRVKILEIAGQPRE